MQVYPVVVYKDEDPDYGTVVPDIPGCVSAGASIEEALAETKEAIYCHLEGLVMDGEVFPKACELTELPREDGAIGLAMVEIDLDRVSAETERVNITLPKWLISAIDAEFLNRSCFLAESAVRCLQEKHRKDVA